MTTKATKANTRVCVKCGERKPLDEFPWRDGAHKHRRSSCRKCESVRRHGESSKRANGTGPRYEYHSRYYLEHKSEISEKAAERWRKKHPTEIVTCEAVCAKYPCFTGIETIKTINPFKCHDLKRKEDNNDV